MDTAVSAPGVTLSNGVSVVNFSSPHPFNFEDGSVLEACSKERVVLGTLDREDEESPFGIGRMVVVTAVRPVFKVTELIMDELERLNSDPEIDVILTPVPVVDALRQQGDLSRLYKVATVCVKDRISKEIFIDRFCR